MKQHNLNYKWTILLWLTSLAITNGSVYGQNPITSLKQQTLTDDIPRKLQGKVARLQAKYWNKGYLEYKIDSFDIDSKKIYHNRGDKYLWGDVTFEDSANLTTPPKGIITPSSFKAFNKKLSSTYKNNGFPFVDISSKAEISENLINITYSIRKGSLIIFDSIHTADSIILNINYLQNLTQIKPNQYYDESKLQNLENTINTSGIYQYTDHDIKFIDNKASVEIELTENKNNLFSGYIGLQPNSENKTNLTGQIALDLNNAFKQGENLSLNWKKNNPNSQLLDAGVRFPFLINSPIGILGSVYIDQQDSTFSNTNLQGGLSFYLTKAAFCSAEARYIKSTINEISPTNTQSVLFGIAYTKNQINNNHNPSKGYYIKLNGFAGNRTINRESSIENYLRIDFDIMLESFIPLGRNTLRMANHLSGIQSDSLNESELLRLGGIQSFRGFDENAIFAKQFNVLTVEYRYLLDEFSNLFVFCDYGISHEIINKQWEFVNRIGFGTGLNINTKAGLLSVAYAFGKEKSSPIKFNQSKIHIGYTARF